MIRSWEIVSIYLTGLLQGLTLVVVPSASLIFIHDFGFSNNEYGLLFVPQVITAMSTSIFGAAMARRTSMKNLWCIGLALNLLAMVCIGLSQAASFSHSTAYWLVFSGTTLVGAGFGTTLPTINVFAASLFTNSASALTVLHTLLGLGTALSPFLVSMLISLGWWYLPVGLAAALMALLAVGFILPFQKVRTTAAATDKDRAFLPRRVRSFMLAVLLYGFCETIFANWAGIFLNHEKAVPMAQTGYALAAFWAMVSLGRILISIISLWISPRWTYRVLPVMIGLSLWAITKADSASMGIALFGLAGLSCSGFFPLTFSLGLKGFEDIAQRVSGWIMAAYMLGYGLASWGLGQVMALTHTSLTTWYLNSIVLALGAWILSLVLT